MLKESNTSSLVYEHLSKEEMTRRGILGRLVGVVADFLNPTRNSRLYSESLWEKVFNNDIMKEKLKNKVVYGELGHPVDRQEIDMEKVAVALAGPPVKGPDGKLRAVFDILSTPNGRILKSLCDYGSTLGISSRGSGDVIQDDFGEDMVDPDTYECECFDVVIVPAVKEARLQYVTESLGNNKSLNQTLKEEYNKSSQDEQKIMHDTFELLGINLNEDYDTANSSDSNIEEIEQEIANIGNSETIPLEQFQDVLLEKAELQKKIATLQEKLSVCYTKEMKFNEEKSALNEEIAKLVASSKDVSSYETKIADLQSKLDEQTKHSEVLNEQLQAKADDNKQDNQKLVAELKQRNDIIKKLSAKVTKLEEGIKSASIKFNQGKDEMQEEINTLKKDSALQYKQYTEKLEGCNRLVEKYQQMADDAVNKYIECQASLIGTTSQIIKEKLPESYSFDDVDRICESFKDYSLSVSALPFTPKRGVSNTPTDTTPKPVKEHFDITSTDDISDDDLLFSLLENL